MACCPEVPICADMAASPVATIRGDVAACLRLARLATVSSVVQFASMRQAAPNPSRRVSWLQFGLARNLMGRPRCETVAEPAPIPDDEASAQCCVPAVFG